MGFKKGDRVVCIDDRPSTLKTMARFRYWIVKDTIYTVREQRPEGAEGGILLEEAKNPPVYFEHFMGKLEPAYHPGRFRKATPDEIAEREREEEVEEA